MRCPECESWNENDAATCRKCRYDFIARESGRRTHGGGFYDFLAFRKLITPDIIKVAYAFGAILLNVAGVVSISSPDLRPDPLQATSPASLVFVILLMNLAWRMLCEGIILFFSIHEVLVSLENGGHR